MHIIVFPGWYPSRIDWLSGDFIQRHMEAIAQQVNVTVVIPVKDENIKKAEKIVEIKDGLTEIYYYYPSVTTIKWLDSLLSFLRYNYTCYQTFNAIHKQNKIDLVHVYVLQKNYGIGLLIKWLRSIPYVISEQSTFYVDGRLEKVNSFSKKVYRFVFNRAASFHAVSAFLLKNIGTKLKLEKQGVVIPNVVNEHLFQYQPRQQDHTTVFVHVSNMVYQKNVEGMLQAFAEVKMKNAAFLLNLVGPIPAPIKTMIAALDLQKQVVIWNEQPYTEVAKIMKQSDVFVFFTRFETFGCVIIEAGACGLPVILSDLEVTRELITDQKNGMLVENENVDELAGKILAVMEGKFIFDHESISKNTRQRFSYETVGKQFVHWYQTILQKNNASISLKQ